MSSAFLTTWCPRSPSSSGPHRRMKVVWVMTEHCTRRFCWEVAQCLEMGELAAQAIKRGVGNHGAGPKEELLPQSRRELCPPPPEKQHPHTLVGAKGPPSKVCED